MLLFIGVFLLVSALTAALLLEQEDWEDLVFHEYNIKRWLQHMEVLKQDANYLASLLDVYTPNKAKVYKKREEYIVFKIASDALAREILSGSDYCCFYVFGFSRKYTTIDENREMALEIARSCGYADAQLVELDSSCLIDIKLGPRSKS